MEIFSEEKIVSEGADEADILSDLISQKEKLDIEKMKEELAQKQLEESIQKNIMDVHNDLAIFVTWMQYSFNKENLYDDFHKNFDEEYRTCLFENVCKYFKNEEFITDEILFYLKCIIFCLLKASRKYKTRIDSLNFDINNRSTNLRLVREKYTIRCFVDDEHLCYFKDNGNIYYVS